MVITRTPFRVSFFGGGTDYPGWYKDNGGSVLSTTINKYCYISCKYLPQIFEHKSRISYSEIELVKSHDNIKHPAIRESLNFMDIDHGVEIHSFNDLPSGTGLGSSSSFTVGMLNTLHALSGNMAHKRQLAMEAIRMEQDILNEDVGSQDQVAAAFGGLNHIKFNGSEEFIVHPITISNERIQELEDHLMLFFTGITRSASDVAKEQIRTLDEKAEELRSMDKLVDDALDILNDENESLEKFGKLLHETWKLKRGLTSKITNNKIDDIYEKGRNAGALGGKLLGAGGGGFVLFFAKPGDQPKIQEELSDLIRVPFRFDTLGSHVIYYTPAELS